MQEVVRSCQTSRLEQELVSKYILLEDYFMRESLSKASAIGSRVKHEHCMAICDLALL